MQELTDPDRPQVKKRPVGLLIAFAVGGIALMGAMLYYWQSPAFVDYNYTLMMSAKGINLTCPRMIDEITRLDSVSVKRDKLFIYHYTFLTFKKDSLDSGFCDRWDENIHAATKGLKDLEQFGENGVTLIYKSRDEDGIELCEVTVTASEYYLPDNLPADSVGK